jgi:hypothetical protein
MGMTQHPTGLPLKPEQTFFDDTALDRMMAMVMTLAAELRVTRDRLTVVEMLLESGQTITSTALDEFQPDPAQKKTLDTASQQFTDALMACTMGVEMSLGAPQDGVAKFDKS